MGTCQLRKVNSHGADQWRFFSPCRSSRLALSSSHATLNNLLQPHCTIGRHFLSDCVCELPSKVCCYLPGIHAKMSLIPGGWPGKPLLWRDVSSAPRSWTDKHQGEQRDCLSYKLHLWQRQKGLQSVQTVVFSFFFAIHNVGCKWRSCVDWYDYGHLQPWTLTQARVNDTLRTEGSRVHQHMHSRDIHHLKTGRQGCSEAFRGATMHSEGETTHFFNEVSHETLQVRLV